MKKYVLFVVVVVVLSACNPFLRHGYVIGKQYSPAYTSLSVSHNCSSHGSSSYYASSKQRGYSYGGGSFKKRTTYSANSYSGGCQTYMDDYSHDASYYIYLSSCPPGQHTSSCDDGAISVDPISFDRYERGDYIDWG